MMQATQPTTQPDMATQFNPKTTARADGIYGTDIVFQGIVMNKTGWAQHLGIEVPSLAYRLENWSLKAALTRPKAPGRPLKSSPVDDASVRKTTEDKIIMLDEFVVDAPEVTANSARTIAITALAISTMALMIGLLGYLT